MNRNLVLLGILSLGRIVRWRGLWTEEKTSYRYCRYTDRKQRVRPE